MAAEHDSASSPTLSGLTIDRARLLEAALSGALSEALSSAQMAEAWLCGDDRRPAPRLALPAPAAQPSPGNKRGARVPGLKRRPRPEAVASRKSHDGSWIEPTLAAVAEMERAGKPVTKPGLANHLDITPVAASGRLRQLTAMGRLTMIGTRNHTSYRLPDAPEPVAAVVESVPASSPPIAKASPPRPKPASLPPAIPAPSAKLVSVDRVAPPLPDEPVDMAGLVRFLRSRDFMVTGGPVVFQVDGHERDVAWLVTRANRIREARGERAFTLRGELAAGNV